ncbi:hypothetical protein V2K05_06630 [Pseudomonas alliivorans]|nr:hypothetical protein [Pseudomonas alliivorans]MEE4883829.1 hypothetical protein [Pseudomonas alliivorans]MEE4962285.1 hypothetical protein [Pseudomonas alliivorans]MEE4970478.1 hypothetical protein [Pseudomonas alliivorans]MEE4975763.1 hypothetical protein [Pseudomonas alliivorans]
MTQAKERPILFSAPMVRAILEGRKTITRREIKPSKRNADTQFELHQQPDGSWLPMHTFDESCMDDQGAEHPITSPYGKPGDRLWGREAWQADAQVDSVTPRDLSQGEPIQYPADGAYRQTGCSMITPGKTRPSIHMPRCVSRILLDITDMRVERLQDISEEQAKAEGVRLMRDGSDAWVSRKGPGNLVTPWPTAKEAFRDLWESIYGAGAWDVNPWVWVVEFKCATP